MKKWGIKKIIKSVYLRLFALVSIPLFFIVLILLGSSTVYSDTSNTNNSSRVETNLNDSPTPAVKPPFDPSPPSTKYFGLWYFVACYIQQPKADYYAKVGENVTIHTKIGRNSQSDWYGSDKHTIHQTDIDTGKWSSIDNGSNSDYTLTSDKPGTIYIQDETQVYPTQFNLHPIYSKMAAVHFTPEKAGPAEKIEITADDDTFYVDNSKNSEFNITARAEITPENAGDKDELQWSTNGTSSARVNADTGEITVDGSIKKDFTVYAKIRNITAEKNFHIKKILTGLGHVFNGQEAYFYLHGPIIEQLNNIKIDWIYNHDERNPITDDVRLQDDAIVISTERVNKMHGGSLYGAVKQKDGSFKQVTNSVVFNKLDEEPVIIGSQLITLNPSDESTPDFTSNVNNVSINDRLQHRIRLKKIAPGTDEVLQDNPPGKLNFQLSKNESLIKIVKTDPTDFSVKNLTEGKDYVLNNSNQQGNIDVKLKLTLNTATTIDIYTLVDQIIAEDAKYKPIYSIDKLSDVKYQVDFRTNYVSFTDGPVYKGALSLHPQNIDYKVANGSSQKYINRVSPGENENILTFDDTRSNKTSVKILLTYVNKFVKPPDTDFITPFIFEYFDENGNVVQAPDNTVILKTTTYGKTPDPIKWKIDRGLKIKTTGDSIPSGTYRTVLIWSATDSVS